MQQTRDCSVHACTDKNLVFSLLNVGSAVLVGLQNRGIIIKCMQLLFPGSIDSITVLVVIYVKYLISTDTRTTYSSILKICFFFNTLSIMQFKLLIRVFSIPNKYNYHLHHNYTSKQM